MRHVAPVRFRARAVYSVFAVALAITGGLLFAGPLDPPAGPVTSTYKTLTEVEPRIAINAANTPGDADSLYRITQPGSYYLTGNITGVVAKRGVEIASGGVTLDLMGFELAGVPGSLQGVAVSGSGPFRNVEVRNGTVRDWGSTGVDMTDSFMFTAALNCRLFDLRASNNGGFGLRGGTLGSIEACHVYQNGSYGIIAGSGGLVVNCTSNSNSGVGIGSGGEAIIKDCTVNDNTGHGIEAINGRCTINGCTVVRSGGDGIVGGEGSTISNCTVLLSGNDGISITYACHILNNTCHRNGLSTADGAGIRLPAFGSNADSRVEGNTLTQNDIGLKVDSTSNLIVRNSASSNGPDFSIVAGNDVGPTGSAATATSPWANIQF